MVKKLLILFMVLGIATTASAATMTLTRSGSGTLAGSATEKIYVYVDDSSLDTLSTTLTVTNGTFNNAIGTADSSDYGVAASKAPDSWGGAVTNSGGWQTDFSSNPVFSVGNTVVEIGLGQFGSTIYGSTDLNTLSDIPSNSTMSPVIHNISVAWVEVTAAGTGDMVLSWTNGSTHGSSSWNVGNTTVPTFGSSLTIPAVPEPMTIALLGLGGLFLRRRK